MIDTFKLYIVIIFQMSWSKNKIRYVSIAYQNI